MQRFAIACVVSGAVFVAIDLLWLSLVMSKLFKAQMPQLILEQPNLQPAAAFYALYPIGIVTFGVLPAVAAQDWVRAAALSALFGFLAYVTYELTNLATLRGWSAQIAMMDIARGAALSGVREPPGIGPYALGQTVSGPYFPVTDLGAFERASERSPPVQVEYSPFRTISLRRWMWQSTRHM